MRKRLVLWDVDHTLINAGGLGPQLYAVVFRQLFGRKPENVAAMPGRTDRAIILDTLTRSGVPEPARHVCAFAAALAAHAPAFTDRVKERGRALPGAVEALRALAALSAGSAGGRDANGGADDGRGRDERGGSRSFGHGAPGGRSAPGVPSVHGGPRAPDERGGSTSPRPSASANPRPSASASPRPGGSTSPRPGGSTSPRPGGSTSPRPGGSTSPRPGGWADEEAWLIVQSVLTGNLRPLAEVKLGALGLACYLDLDVGAYGDLHEVRAELAWIARERAVAAYGTAFPGETTVLIGDTPLDIEAARAAGARSIGVATGATPTGELTAAGAHVVLPDLTDTAAVVEAILG